MVAWVWSLRCLRFGSHAMTVRPGWERGLRLLIQIC